MRICLDVEQEQVIMRACCHMDHFVTRVDLGADHDLTIAYL